MLTEDEFIKQINSHEQIIHKVCNLYMDNSDDRKDLFQEIVLQAWKGSREFRREAKFSTWLYRVSLNTAITMLKKEKKHAAVIANVNTEMTRQVDEGEDHYAVMFEAIEQLPAIDKALVMLYLDDLPYQEISTIMGISENNIAVKMNRIKTRLRETTKKFL